MVDIRESSGALHRERHNGSGIIQPIPNEVPFLVRVMTKDDLPWLIDLCKDRYGPRYDEQSTISWYLNCVLPTPILFYPSRTNNAFCISMLQCTPWLPAEFEVNVMFICAERGAMWQALTLLHSSIEWAKQRNAVCWRLTSETDFDLAPFAKRLGATEVTSRFTLRI